MMRSVIGFACILALSAVSLADDWPQWLGPQRDGVWRETGILDVFPAEGPKINWRLPIGGGYAGPAVADGRVYVTDRIHGEGAHGQERVLCLDAATGRVAWAREYECRYEISYPAGPRVAPLVDGGKLYTLGAEGNLFCLNATDGKVVWSRELKKDYGVKAPMWGFAGHPLIDGNRLICLVAGTGTTAVAFDKETGKELWRALHSEEPGYSSPMICEAWD